MDTYATAIDQNIRPYLNRIDVTHLASRGLDDLAGEILADIALEPVARDTGREVRGQRTAGQVVVRVPVVPSKLLRQIKSDNIMTTSWSGSFSREALVIDDREGWVQYPADNDTADGIKGAQARIESFLTTLNEDITRCQPRVVETVKSACMKAIERAKNEVQRRKDVESGSGIKFD